MDIQTYTLPSYWASYLINGDASGLENGEEDEIDEWLLSKQPGYCVGVGDDHWFSRSNDAGTLAGDVAEYTFIKHFH